VSFWFAALALPSITAPFAGWLALPVGTFATLIPSTPGYIGTFDYFVVRAMTEFKNPKSAATVYALLMHALVPRDSGGRSVSAVTSRQSIGIDEPLT